MGPSPDLFSFRLENPLRGEGWNQLISALGKGSIFHRCEWARVLSDTYGFTPVYLATNGGPASPALLPLFEVTGWLRGKRAVSLPFTDECGVVGTSQEANSALLSEALQMGRQRGWRYLEIRGGQNLFAAAPPSMAYYGHRLELTQDPERLFARFDSSVRRAIRKAQKSELTIEFSQTLAATQEYYALHCRLRREHGLPPQPFAFFQHIQEHLLAPQLGVVVTARFHGRPLAAAVFLQQGPTAVYKFGASVPAALELRANNLVMWEGIQWLAARGARQLQFGRTDCHHDGLRRYKLGWGTEEYPIHYYKYDFQTQAVVPVRDQTQGWHNALFRALPLPLARWAGKWLYPQMA